MFLSGSGGCGKRKYILWIIFFENYENKPIFVVYLSLRACLWEMRTLWQALFIFYNYDARVCAADAEDVYGSHNKGQP